MNRKEYMNALEEALRPLPEEVRAAALEFYGEMIDDRMEDGMDEASAVAAMEPPADIAARLRTEACGEGANAAQDQTARANAAGDAQSLEDEAMEFSSLADRVMRAASQAMERAPELVNAGMEQAEKVMEQAEKAMEQAARQWDDQAARAGSRDSTLNQEESDGAYTWKTFTCPVGQVRSIRLLARDMPISVSPCAGDTVTLRYYTSTENPYTLTLADGELSLRHPEKASRGGFSLERLGGLFHIVWGHPSATIYLEMPGEAFVDLLAHTSNGSIKLGGFSALCQVNLKTSNSRIEMTDTVCKALDMESSNGRLVLRRVESKQRLRGKTSNSRIEAEGVRSGESVSLHTSNARIQAKEVTAQGEVDLKTSNGSVTVAQLQAACVILKTSNGGISGILPGRQTDWAIDSGTSNGHNSLPKSQPGQRRLSAHTSNASIDVRFREE